MDEQASPSLDQLHDQVPPGEIMEEYIRLMDEKYRGREHERPLSYNYMDWDVWVQASGGYRNGHIRGFGGNLIIRDDYEGVSHGTRVSGSYAMPRRPPPHEEREALARQEQLDREYAQHEAEMLENVEIQAIVQNDPTWLSRMKESWYTKRAL